MVPVVTGVALAFRQRAERRVALTWIGDGTTRTAAVHEGLNLAAVLRVPGIFIIQNNQVALGTRLEQHHAGDFGAWGKMYGVPCALVDGNHVLDVYAGVREAVERARGGDGPSLIVAETFRMGGHATHDEAEARTTFDGALFERWGRRDPIALFEEYLVAQGVARERLSEIEGEIDAEANDAAERALAAREASMPAPESAELEGISAGVRQPGITARVANVRT
jgi:pyruvate dehydrogenase E1 component alpha subunit